MRVVPVRIAALKKVTHSPQYNESIFNNLEWKNSVPELLKRQLITALYQIEFSCSYMKSAVLAKWL